MVNITKYGAVGDGVTDCSPAIAKALETETEIFFPAGVYAVTEEILIPSNRYLKLDKDAVIFAADHCFDKAGCRAVIANADQDNGNENIIIEGGKIDANNKNNARASWKNGPNRGLTFCFKRVKNLTVRDMICHNAESYNFHMCRVEDFVIEDIRFSADHLTRCQDGVHVGAFCHRGVIRNIHADFGSTNDDLLAFSADEDHTFIHNEGLEDGPISDMLIENVYAENCWSAIRVLSVKQEIKNLTFRNITAGVRIHGINMDGSRYLGKETRFFQEEDCPNGVGNVKNILFENITFWRTDRIWQEEYVDKPDQSPMTIHTFLIPLNAPKFNVLETKGDITIRNLRRDREKDCNPSSMFLDLCYLYDTTVIANGEIIEMHGEQLYLDEDCYDLTIRSKGF